MGRVGEWGWTERLIGKEGRTERETGGCKDRGE